MSSTDLFPWKRLLMSEDGVHEMMDNLRELNIEKRIVKTKFTIDLLPKLANHRKNLSLATFAHNFDGQYIMAIYDDLTDYKDFNVMSDYWTEDERLEAHRDGHPSPLECWAKNRQAILKKAKTLRGLHPLAAQREAVYMMCKEVSSQRPMAVFILQKLLDVTSHLEMCCGFGNNLLASIASGVKTFVGVEPRESLHLKYKKIIEFFGVAKGYSTIVGAFEDVDLGTQKFDLVYSSPPYFRFEIYDDIGENQSVNKYKDFEEWYNSFLLASCIKGWNHTKKGGHFAIIINHVNLQETYVYKLLDDLDSLFDNAEYKGMLPFARFNQNKVSKAQPIFIWKKI